MMNVQGKSDPPIVPAKSPNNAASAAAEAMEGRGGAKGNAVRSGTRQTQSWESVSPALDRIRDAARRDKRVRFTALLHHVTVDLLRFVGSSVEETGGAGRRRRHMGRVRGGPGEQSPRPARTRSPGCISSEAVTAAVHPQTGRPAAAARASRRWRTRSSSGRWGRC